MYIVYIGLTYANTTDKPYLMPCFFFFACAQSYHSDLDPDLN